jgi:predicted nucleic acid-binding protein
MEKIDQPIIADTSALVSLATDTDHNHRQGTESAVRLRSANRPILLPSDVFVETMNILGKRSGHDTALKAANSLLRSGSQFILIGTAPYIEPALVSFSAV